jgi:type II secretory pathway component PulJ
MRLRPNSAFFPVIVARRSGYTIVEILVASTLTLILMTAVVTVFGGVGDGISQSRRALEQFDRLRSTVQQFRRDLQGATVTPDGRAAKPEQSPGYLEVINPGDAQKAYQLVGKPGNFTAYTSYSSDPVAVSTGGTLADSTVGPRGSVVMLTSRNAVRPFTGRYQLGTDPNNPTLQSDVAEVAWYLRGTTLHRRVLLVAPGVAQRLSVSGLSPATFFQGNDISVRQVNGKLVPNSLADLTKRENRFAHPVDKFPFDVRRWGLLGLPTLAECSSPTWMGNWTAGTTPLPNPSAVPFNTSAGFSQIDMWGNIPANAAINATTLLPDQFVNQANNDGTRLADDVVLTNVIGFDVKFWDPLAPLRSYTDPSSNQVLLVKPGDMNYSASLTIVSYGAYVDLGWSRFDPNYLASLPPTAPTPAFYNLGNPKSLLNTGSARVYDSGCFSYENEGIYTFNNTGNPVSVPPTSSSYPPGLGQGTAGNFTNGLVDQNNSDPGYSVVGSPDLLITSPPYPVALRGIQVKIRCFEPDSRQIREVTVEQDFLPK